LPTVTYWTPHVSSEAEREQTKSSPSARSSLAVPSNALTSMTLSTENPPRLRRRALLCPLCTNRCLGCRSELTPALTTRGKKTGAANANRPSAGRAPQTSSGTGNSSSPQGWQRAPGTKQRQAAPAALPGGYHRQRPYGFAGSATLTST